MERMTRKARLRYCAEALRRCARECRSGGLPNSSGLRNKGYPQRRSTTGSGESGKRRRNRWNPRRLFRRLRLRRIVVACGKTDLRKGIDGLAAVVEGRLRLNPGEKNVLFLFCGTRPDRINGLVFEGDGYLLLGLAQK